MAHTVKIDFSDPQGADPSWPFDWDPTAPSPDLSIHYPGQPMEGLRFAASDGVANIRFYLDHGLVLVFEATAPNQSLGLFVHRPRMPIGGAVVDAPLYDVAVTVGFDAFDVENKWIGDTGAHVPQAYAPFQGAVAALCTSADAWTGQLGPPHGIGTEQNDLNIGGTCAIGYDPPPDQQRMRLNYPANIAKAGPPKPDFSDFQFLGGAPVPPMPAPVAGQPAFFNHSNYSLLLRAEAHVSPNADEPALISLELVQASDVPGGLKFEKMEGIQSAWYTNDFTNLKFAGASLIIGLPDQSTPPNDVPPNLGPLRVRITSLQVDFQT